MSEEISIRQAEFDPAVCTYWLIQGACGLAFSCVGIPLLLLWFPFGLLLTRRQLDRMSCELTDKALKVRKGIFVRVEKTIPLEKITDMGMVQGPIMRHFNLYTLTVETAGSGAGALVSLTGIVDAQAFREAVLNQREAISTAAPQPATGTAQQTSPEAASLLGEIRDSLLRIEAKLEQRNDS